MSLTDRLWNLESEFKRFETNFQKELNEIKSEVHQPKDKLDKIIKLQAATMQAGLSLDCFIISPDIEKILLNEYNSISSTYSSEHILTLLGLPVEVDKTRYNYIGGEVSLI
jgi:hypothetical protein